MAAISTIRNKFGWLLIALMVLSLVAFILMDSQSSGNRNTYKQSDELAIVDGEALSNTEFSERLTNNINNYKQQRQTAELSEADMDYIRNSTYNQMVSESLLKKVYSKAGIAVSDEEFRDMTTGNRVHPGIANSFKDASGNFDLDAFNNFVNNLDIENNPGDLPGTKRKAWVNFENGIVNERMSKKYNTLIEKGLTIPSAMAKDDYMNAQSQVNFNYVKIPFSSIPDTEVNLSDADLKSFMTKHYKKYEKDASVDLKIASFPITYSQNDKVAAEKWMNSKFEEWKEKGEDSLFINLYSDQALDMAYYGEDELFSNFKDASIFDAKLGSFFGPKMVGDAYVAEKIIDRKMIPDSLKARHLLISFDKVASQEEAFAKRQLFDSLYALVDSANVPLESLTAQFSDDKSNAGNGGDLGMVKPGQMVKPFNDLIFFNMKQGDVKTVATQFGLHIVEVYKAKPTKKAVRIATLKKQILPSAKTQEKTYADASIFSGNNNTQEKFLEAGKEKTLTDAASITKESSNLPQVKGNARQIVKWAFKDAEIGEVSSPFSVGDAYYVVMLVNKNEKGIPNITDNNRLAIQVDAMNAKKAALIEKKISGTDLNAIASANNATVATASNVLAVNPTIEGIQEPKVVGTALSAAEGTTSAPIVGNDGVYVLTVSSKSIPEATAEAYQQNKSSLFNKLKYGVTSKLSDAIRKASDVQDNRLDFF